MSANPHPSRVLCPRTTRLPPPGPPPCLQTAPRPTKAPALALPTSQPPAEQPATALPRRTPDRRPSSTRPGKGGGGGADRIHDRHPLRRRRRTMTEPPIPPANLPTGHPLCRPTTAPAQIRARPPTTTCPPARDTTSTTTNRQGCSPGKSTRAARRRPAAGISWSPASTPASPPLLRLHHHQPGPRQGWTPAARAALGPRRLRQI